jgi:hypothetical protein
MKFDPRIAREKLRIAVRDANKFPEVAKGINRARRGSGQGSLKKRRARLLLRSDTNLNCLTEGGTLPPVAISGANVDLLNHRIFSEQSWDFS